MQTTISKAIRIGRATAIALGVGVMLALVLGLATVALAAVPGDPFKLGQVNVMDSATTTLQGGPPTSSGLLRLQRTAGIGAVLKVENTKPAGIARGIDISVPAGNSPISVSPGAGKASGLNADEVDGKDSSEFMSDNTYIKKSISVDGPGDFQGVDFGVNCDPEDLALGGGGLSFGFRDHLNQSFPADSNTWSVEWEDGGDPGTFQAYAVCADFPPLR